MACNRAARAGEKCEFAISNGEGRWMRREFRAKTARVPVVRVVTFIGGCYVLSDEPKEDAWTTVDVSTTSVRVAPM